MQTKLITALIFAVLISTGKSSLDLQAQDASRYPIGSYALDGQLPGMLPSLHRSLEDAAEQSRIKRAKVTHLDSHGNEVKPNIAPLPAPTPTKSRLQRLASKPVSEAPEATQILSQQTPANSVRSLYPTESPYSTNQNSGLQPSFADATMPFPRTQSGYDRALKHEDYPLPEKYPLPQPGMMQAPYSTNQNSDIQPSYADATTQSPGTQPSYDRAQYHAGYPLPETYTPPQPGMMQAPPSYRPAPQFNADSNPYAYPPTSSPYVADPAFQPRNPATAPAIQSPAPNVIVQSNQDFVVPGTVTDAKSFIIPQANVYGSNEVIAAKPKFDKHKDFIIPGTSVEMSNDIVAAKPKFDKHKDFIIPGTNMETPDSIVSTKPEFDKDRGYIISRQGPVKVEQLVVEVEPAMNENMDAFGFGSARDNATDLPSDADIAISDLPPTKDVSTSGTAPAQDLPIVLERLLHPERLPEDDGCSHVQSAPQVHDPVEKLMEDLPSIDLETEVAEQHDDHFEQLAVLDNQDGRMIEDLPYAEVDPATQSLNRLRSDGGQTLLSENADSGQRVLPSVVGEGKRFDSIPHGSKLSSLLGGDGSISRHDARFVTEPDDEKAGRAGGAAGSSSVLEAKRLEGIFRDHLEMKQRRSHENRQLQRQASVQQIQQRDAFSNNAQYQNLNRFFGSPARSSNSLR